MPKTYTKKLNWSLENQDYKIKFYGDPIFMEILFCLYQLFIVIGNNYVTLIGLICIFLQYHN